MKKMFGKKIKPSNEEMRSEYKLDYSKSHPNRFAGRGRNNQVIILDSDVSEVFKNSESVNEVLRALISTMPKVKGKKAA